MKVELTERRTVDAESKWFKVRVTERRVTVNAPGVGTLHIARTREGLEVSLQPASVNGFMELGTSAGDSLEPRQFASGSFTAKVRSYGNVTLGEMADIELREQVELWAAGAKQNATEIASEASA